MRLVIKKILTIVLFIVTSCTYEHWEKVAITCANSTISLTYTETDVSTCGATDGSIAVSGAGGVLPYTFSLNEGDFIANGNFSNLAAGSYSISMKDSLGCTVKENVLVNTKQTTTDITVKATASGCSSPSGTITVSASGGIAPYQYKINSGSYQSSNIFSSLSGGNYTVTVIDASSCTSSVTANVPSTAPSFSATINPIITASCLGGCHDSRNSPNLVGYANISAHASSIVSAINNNMPPGGKLSSQQISEITCWVNAGAANN